MGTSGSKSGEGGVSPSGGVDFSALIMGFSSAALYSLGEHPVNGKAPAGCNLALARQNIDIIVLLRDKTKGNLSAEEDRLVQQVMTDLQLKFLEASAKAK